jgi:hypothetical protein
LHFTSATGEGVKPEQIGKQIIAEHITLKATLEQLESVADEVLAKGDDRLDALRNLAADFGDALLAHMDWEDTNLAPALLACGERGEEPAARLARDHSEQRDLLEHIFRGLADASRPGRIVARNLLDLCRLLSSDFVDEEEMLLEAGFLPDDAVPGGAPDNR